MALRQTDRECEECGNVIRAAEIYFANQDGGDLHVDCHKASQGMDNQGRLILRRGIIIDPMKTSCEKPAPWSHAGSL